MLIVDAGAAANVADAFVDTLVQSRPNLAAMKAAKVLTVLPVIMSQSPTLVKRLSERLGAIEKRMPAGFVADLCRQLGGACTSRSVPSLDASTE